MNKFKAGDWVKCVKTRTVVGTDYTITRDEIIQVKEVSGNGRWFTAKIPLRGLLTFPAYDFEYCSSADGSKREMHKLLKIGDKVRCIETHTVVGTHVAVAEGEILEVQGRAYDGSSFCAIYEDKSFIFDGSKFELTSCDLPEVTPPDPTIQIDYGLIAAALRHYTTLGYKRVEVPWIVALRDLMTTAPTAASIVRTPKFNGLIGSAEQGFISLQRRGLLETGRYVAVSPCFRNEPIYDEHHLPWFMKIELYVIGGVTYQTVLDLVGHAFKFHEDYAPGAVRIVEMADGLDLHVNGIEVGSYGFRTLPDGNKWAYGTGLALPRFTQAIG